MKDTNLPYLQERYNSYWNKENHDRPLLALYTPDPQGRAQAVFPPPATSFEQQWLDFDRVLACSRPSIASTHFLGEAYPSFCPNLGPDILGAVLGCGLGFGASTSWAIHTRVELTDQPDFVFNERNLWWQRILDLTHRAVSDAKGDYIVGVTDLHAGMDALVSLRSPQNLCYDMADCPELVEKFVWQAFDVFK